MPSGGAAGSAPYQVLAPIRRRAFALARKPEIPGLPPAGGGARIVIPALERHTTVRQHVGGSALVRCARG